MTFIKAKPIWSIEYQKQMNITLFCSFDCTKNDLQTLVITANNFYRVFINGMFYAYGPARAPHGYARVDSYNNLPLSNTNRIVIEVLSNHCRSFYSLDTDPFIQFETLDANGNITNYSCLDTPLYLNTSRLQKVTRFSYQRGFSESYSYSEDNLSFLSHENNSYPKVQASIVNEVKLLERNTPIPNYYQLAYQLYECGKVRSCSNNEVYDDRYMHLDSIGIFPMDQWEIDSNKTASYFNYYPVTKAHRALTTNHFATYRFPISKTGFITLDIKASQDSLVYILFDEIDTKESSDSLTKICFYRNTTHNCITYDLKRGNYHLLSIEPYTAKYIRVIILKGKVTVRSVGLIEYENPDMNNSYFELNNKKLLTVIKAARNTLAQNAVDILTDCPSRERAGWLFDSFFSSRAEQLFTGKNLVEKCFLENYYLCPKDGLPKGMIPMCYPADYDKNYFIPNWSLWYIIEIEDYFKRTGDLNLVNKSLTNIRGLLTYFARFENEDGLLEDLESWVFVEWSKANNYDHICGVNYPSNMLYVGVLKSAAKLLNDKTLLFKAERIAQVIRNQSFNGKYFIDNSIRINEVLTPTSNLTETCQYYAFYFDVATKELYPQLFETLISSFGPERDHFNTHPNVSKSNVLPGYFLRLEILNKYGFFNKVLDETVDYFYGMASLTGTLWEHDSSEASLNHAFASYVVNIILRPAIGLISINCADKIITFEKSFLLNNIKANIKVGDDFLTVTIDNGDRIIKEPLGYKIIISCESEKECAQ